VLEGGWGVEVGDGVAADARFEIIPKIFWNNLKGAGHWL
jgi:hypothetical protein